MRKGNVVEFSRKWRCVLVKKRKPRVCSQVPCIEGTENIARQARRIGLSNSRAAEAYARNASPTRRAVREHIAVAGAVLRLRNRRRTRINLRIRRYRMNWIRIF